MKKIFLIMLVAALYVSADTTIVNTRGLNGTPSDINVVSIVDGVSDVIEDSTMVTYGPYRLFSGDNQPMYSGFQFISAGLGGTSPVAGVAYQLSATSTTTDTVAANWVYFDSLAETGSSIYVDLSSKAGKFVWFRVHNHDATYDTLRAITAVMKE